MYDTVSNLPPASDVELVKRLLIPEGYSMAEMRQRLLNWKPVLSELQNMYHGTNFTINGNHAPDVVTDEILAAILPDGLPDTDVNEVISTLMMDIEDLDELDDEGRELLILDLAEALGVDRSELEIEVN